MKNQVLSIKQMQKLKELGIDVRQDEICFHYRFDGGDTHRLEFAPSYYYDDIKAFTLQDIIELLPKQLPPVDFGYNCFLVTPNSGITGYVFHYKDIADGEIYKQIYSEKILDAAYEMLVWVAENKYLTSK